jgi:hypothetical protein
MKRKTEIRLGTLAIGIVTALAIVISQFFSFQDADQSKLKKETKTEQHDTQSGDEAYLTVSTSLPSSFHVEIQQETFFLFEILLEDEKGTETHIDFGTPVNQFFQTLFGTIIAPNAP